MLEQLIRAVKGVLPDSVWDFIFDQFKPHEVKFSQPSYSAVRVSKDYMLVKVETKGKS